MSEEMKNGCSCGGSCGTCCGMHSHKKHMMVKILMLVVIIMAFSLGMMIGEIKGELRSGGFRMGHGSMMRGYGNEYPDGFGMMGGYGKNLKNVQSSQTTPAQATPAKQ